MTFLELLIVVAVIGLLSTLAVVNLHQARMRARIGASKANLRTLSDGLEHYHVDHGIYPRPQIGGIGDPYGVVASTALRGLTTPIAYISPAAFHDPFGVLKVQVGSTNPTLSQGGGFRPPEPGFNTDQSLLYFYYPYLAQFVGKPSLFTEGYSAVSIGPDLKDSFIVYYPFPEWLPPGAAAYGVLGIHDTIYDPTNGVESGGDLAGFGGAVGAPRFVGGGSP